MNVLRHASSVVVRRTMGQKRGVSGRLKSLPMRPSFAELNFGDCLTCATTHLAGQPLLFVGDDFRKTDLEPA